MVILLARPVQYSSIPTDNCQYGGNSNYTQTLGLTLNSKHSEDCRSNGDESFKSCKLVKCWWTLIKFYSITMMQWYTSDHAYVSSKKANKTVTPVNVNTKYVPLSADLSVCVYYSTFALYRTNCIHIYVQYDTIVFIEGRGSIFARNCDSSSFTKIRIA